MVAEGTEKKNTTKKRKRQQPVYHDSIREPRKKGQKEKNARGGPVDRESAGRGSNKPFVVFTERLAKKELDLRDYLKEARRTVRREKKWDWKEKGERNKSALTECY